MKTLLKKLGIKTKNVNLYITAFTHTSYANENNTESYERLEFLGDTLVDAIVSDYLYNKNLSEGEMTKIRASYVCENALSQYAKDLEFDKYIKVGNGEKSIKTSIQADVFEALIGAIYLDLGFNKTKRIVLNIITPYIENPNIMFFNDYKTKLQEVVQDLQKDLVYELTEESGPAHNKSFTYIVKIDDIVYGKGSGHTKKEAEQEAAKSALDKLITK